MTARDPLGPFTRLVRLLWVLTALLTAGGSVTSSTRSALTSGKECFRTSLMTGAHGGHNPLRDGVVSTVELERVCISAPTAWERVLGFLAEAPTPFARAAALLMLLLLLEKAARDGVHTRDTARRLHRLGVFLLVVLPVASVLEVCSSAWLFLRVVDPDREVLEFLFDWDVPWWAVVTGAGLPALAKIMGKSAEMREELEGTV
ncbi:hypothetical protein [Saccharothrix syringae]|uniref:DUF2975 domain-containing protein n=1 Tax=Saccharothrix syringae TaxID=103733 RepID=A0A5Q0GSC9_SACSY|nr:hypothetical protein [Saccharothrix syringae]QFZ16878.1 hypothetical protein EKG83_04810 [Saccharothrix syringae]